MLRLTFNPGLTLTGFRTTRPWRPDPDETYVDVFSITRETIFLCFSPILFDCSLPAQDSEGGSRGHD